MAAIIFRFISSCCCARSRAACSSPCERWGCEEEPEPAWGGAEGRKPGGSWKFDMAVKRVKGCEEGDTEVWT